MEVELIGHWLPAIPDQPEDFFYSGELRRKCELHSTQRPMIILSWRCNTNHQPRKPNQLSVVLFYIHEIHHNTEILSSYLFLVNCNRRGTRYLHIFIVRISHLILRNFYPRSEADDINKMGQPTLALRQEKIRAKQQTLGITCMI